MRKTLLATYAFLGFAMARAEAPQFFPDDPIWDDHDRLPIPQPQPVEVTYIADLLENTFLRRPTEPISPARNVNTLGEVPNSSWFTNRIGLHEMSREELVRGPNELDGPDLSQPLHVLSLKTEGLSPGFTVRDARGDVYIVKFDAPPYPQLATSAETISTKFFHAFGYYVPENYLVFVTPADFLPAPEGTIEEADRNRPLTQEDLAYVLTRLPRIESDRIPALASRFLPGEPLGPFEYFGTRTDDPNDIFPHQDRRELRGLRLFSAWLNHDDSRSANTLDMYVREGEGGYIRHYLIDFGSTLGSGTIEPQNPRAGHEYMLEWTPILKAALTAGIWDRPWRDIAYPQYPSVGNIESEFFEPTEWKPEYPNPAFERMLPEDAFWAAKIVHRFEDEDIRAIVETGRLRNKQAEEYLVETLIERRDKIVCHYFSLLNPLDRFSVSKEGTELRFRNLGLEAGLSDRASYHYQWFEYANQEPLKELGESHLTSSAEIPIPRAASPYLMVRIATRSPEQPAWEKPVDVYLRNEAARDVVGVDREE